MPNIISVAPFDWSQLEKDTEFISWRGSSQSWADALPASEERFIDSLLEIYSDDNTDEYEHFPKWEVVRNPNVYFCCKNRCDSGGHRSVRYNKFQSKPKENK